MKRFSSVAITSLLMSQNLAATGIAVGGNVNELGPIVALISSDNQVQPINLNLAGSGTIIVDASINSSSQAIVGGGSSTTPYAALILADRSVQPLNLGFATGAIYATAINPSSIAIIGGNNGGVGYAAVVSPSGAIQSLPITLDNTATISINSSAQALIAGGISAPYAYYVNASVPSAPTLSPLTLPGFSGGAINSVAINDNYSGIVGGRDVNAPYVGLMTLPTQSVQSISAATLGFAQGAIGTVAINSNSLSIVGGRNDITSAAYAAIIYPYGVVSPVLNLNISNGVIQTSAINNAGRIIIGGISGGGAYAAFVSPDAQVTQAFNFGITTGEITSVAINSASQALVGGFNGSFPTTAVPFIALISPTGDVIPLQTGVSLGIINAVDLLLSSQVPLNGLGGNNAAFANYINAHAPENTFYFIPAILNGTLDQALASAAPTRNGFAIYTADNNWFYFDTLFSLHSQSERVTRHKKQKKVVANIAAAEDLTAWNTDKVAAKKVPEVEKERPYEVWFAPFGALSYQKKQKQTPAFNPTSGGLVLAFDGKITSQERLGAGAAYAYTYIHERENAGHSRIQQEYLFLYSMWDSSTLYFDLALWGGHFQATNLRKIHITGFEFESKSHVNGWQVAPHFEIGYQLMPARMFSVEPFVMLDWIYNWQNSYKEKGKGPFNAGVKRHTSSMLRAEISSRFYETISFENWRLVIQEKIGYVGKKPFKVGTMNAFLVGSPGSFTVETLTAPQNLGVGQFELEVQPVNPKYPTSSIRYQGEFGSRFQSHMGSIELNWTF